MSREHLAHANVAGAPIWVKLLWRHARTGGEREY
jgi:hypothetical protein